MRSGAATPVGVIVERRSPNPPTSVFDPLTVAKAIWNAKRLIAVTTVLGLLAAGVVAMVTPKVYVATTQVLVDPRDIKVVANEVTPNALPSEATLALIESQTSVIMSSNILSRVIADAGLDQDPEFNGERRTGLATLLPPSVAALLAEPSDDSRKREYFVQARLRHALTVARETKSFVINLSVASQEAEKSARLANLTASIFIDDQGRVQSDTARRATTALSSRLSELRQSVVEAEGAVEDYKSRNALIGVGGRLVDDQYITRINDELARIRGNIPSLRVKADSMRSASVEDVVRGTLPEELSSTALVRLRQSYSDLEQQAAVLAARLGPRHPQRIASEGALSAARQAIESELARIVSSAQTELARAEGTERDLSLQIDDLKGKQIETSGAFVKLRELEREVDASRAVYEAFLLRAREIGEQESLNTANIRIISEATPPLQPAGLSRKVVVLVGGIVGFGIGIGLAALFAVLKLTRAFFAGERRRNRDIRWREDMSSPSTETGSSGVERTNAMDTAPGAVALGEAPPVAVYDADPPRPDTPVADMRPAVYETAEQRKPSAPPELQPGATVDDGPSPDRAESGTIATLADPSQGAAAALGAEPVAASPQRQEGPTPSPAETDRDVSSDGAVPTNSQGQPAAAAKAVPSPSNLSLAHAVRGVPQDRLDLRESVRALSDTAPQAERPQMPDLIDPQIALIHDEILTVKRAISDIRKRRDVASAAV